MHALLSRVPFALAGLSCFYRASALSIACYADALSYSCGKDVCLSVLCQNDGIYRSSSVEDLSGVFQPTQHTQRIYELAKWRTQRKERNEMTSLLDRPITAASDDGVCRWHAAKLWQTRAKLLKLNLICIISCTTSKNCTKIWTVDLKKKFKP